MIGYEHYIWKNPIGNDLRDWEDISDSFICELDQMGQKYNCDKANVQYMAKENKNVPPDWPDNFRLKLPGHNYLKVYSEYFEPLRYEKINILEIGMGNYPSNGNSMRLWLEFFPNAKITVLDMYPANFNCNFEFDKSRVRMHVADQSSEEELKRFAAELGDEKFDFIIDDGSHQATHQILSLYTLFPSILKDNGVYFIEDIHDSEFINYLPALYSNLNNGEVSSNYRLDDQSADLGILSILMHRSLICIHKGKKITR